MPGRSSRIATEWSIPGRSPIQPEGYNLARYTQTIEDQFRPGAFTAVSTNYLPPGRILALGYTHIFSPTSVNGLSLSATQLAGFPGLGKRATAPSSAD